MDWCAKDLSMDTVNEGITILQSTGHERSYNSICSQKINTDEYFINHMSTMSFTLLSVTL